MGKDGGDEFEIGNGFGWQEWVEENRWRILMVLVGLFLLGMGVRYWQSAQMANNGDRVEILFSEDMPLNSSNLMIDVGGAVVNPGVYELEQGSRVEEALIAAGGLSESADLLWVERVLNRAERVKDGQKLYVLSVEESADVDFIPNSEVIAGAAVSGSVSVNTANQKELESLWGIGPVTAEAIVSGRPYGAVEELVDKGILKKNVWERNRDKLSL